MAVSSAWVALAVLLATAVSVALAWTSAQVHHANETIERDTDCMVLGDRITTALLLLERGDRDASRAADGARYVAQIREMVARERDLAHGEHEAALVGRVARHFEEYASVRDALLARGAPPTDVAAATTEPLDATLAALAELRDANGRDVAASEQAADRVDEVVRKVATALAVALALAVLVLAFGARRLVALPLRRLHDAIVRFRSGERGVRVRPEGPHEVAAIGGALDEMIVQIERRRDEQLAFVGGVAHDLRGPLGPLKMAVALLAADPGVAASGPASRHLEIASRQIDRLTRMIGDLLDAARVESGRLDLRRASFDLGALTRAVVAIVTPTAPRHRIEVRVPEVEVLVDGDAERIEQVVTNLISNACKYSPADAPIEIVLEPDRDDAVLSVVDHGIGIPAEAQAQIFVPFQRHAAARAIAPGTGLGLSVARRIVEAHGGRIEVESAPGVGSTFRVRLPRAVPGD